MQMSGFEATKAGRLVGWGGSPFGAGCRRRNFGLRLFHLRRLAHADAVEIADAIDAIAVRRRVRDGGLERVRTFADARCVISHDDSCLAVADLELHESRIEGAA